MCCARCPLRRAHRGFRCRLCLDPSTGTAYVLPAFELEDGAASVSTKAEVARAFNKTVQPFYFRLCWKCQRYTDFARWLGSLGDTPSGGPGGPNDGSFEVSVRAPNPSSTLCAQAPPTGHSHPPRTRPSHLLHPSTTTAATHRHYPPSPSTMVALRLTLGLLCVPSRIRRPPKRRGKTLLAAVKAVWLA